MELSLLSCAGVGHARPFSKSRMQLTGSAARVLSCACVMPPATRAVVSACRVEGDSERTAGMSERSSFAACAASHAFSPRRGTMARPPAARVMGARGSNEGATPALRPTPRPRMTTGSQSLSLILSCCVRACPCIFISLTNARHKHARTHVSMRARVTCVSHNVCTERFPPCVMNVKRAGHHGN